MKKIIIALVIIGIGTFAYMQYNKPHRNIAEETAAFKLTANELYDTFSENEMEANKKYLDQTIEVKGRIVDISKDQNQKSIITLEAENAMIGGVMCTLDEDVILEENEEVNLKCKCTGFLEDVIMINCSKVK